MKTTRRVVQLGFLALVLVGVFLVGGNAERWCPFGGVEALYTYVTEGNMTCSLGTSNFFILGGVVIMALILRRAFCGYMCPIGTISEWLGAAAGRLGVPALRVPGPLDRALAGLKYVVLAVILYFTWRAGELLFRGYDPCYALISRHGADITAWAYVVAGAVAAASLVVALPFCRWFCPFAAVLHPFSRFGLTRIKRDGEACTSCGKCAKSCPMNISVDKVREVTAARCLSCFNCVESCPHQRSGALTWGPPRWLGGRWPQAALVALLLFCTGGAVAGSYLFPMPSFVKVHGTAPLRTATVDLTIGDLACRGRANLLFWYIERNDLGPPLTFFKLEAWPGPASGRARITYDPGETSQQWLKMAITEPYYIMQDDVREGYWLSSPFRIEGYDPLALDPLEGLDPGEDFGDPAR